MKSPVDVLSVLDRVVLDGYLALDQAATREEFNAARAAVADLIAERDALRADAERYRWLRDSGKFVPSLGHGAWGLALGIWSASAESLDRAVDNDRARGGAG